MASSNSLHEARRSHNQQPSTLSSQVNSISEGSGLNHQRVVKPLSRGPDRCPGALRGGGYLKEGDAIQFFSRSAEAWLDGEVAEILEDDLIRVDYRIGQYWISKTFHPDSDDIVIPSATGLCSEESDPLAGGVVDRFLEWLCPEVYEKAKQSADNLVPLHSPSAGRPNKTNTGKSAGFELFHQTDEATARTILSTQEMKPGSKGLAGGGIYFATTEGLTSHKAHAHGVILRAYVRLGKILTLPGHGDRQMTGNKLKNMGFDSVCIARQVSSGHEYVVYDPAQVLYIERA